MQDMADYEVPDKFSIVTYVSQYYHKFKDEDNSRYVSAHEQIVTCPAA